MDSKKLKLERKESWNQKQNRLRLSFQSSPSSPFHSNKIFSRASRNRTILFSSVDVDDLVLVDVLEDVRRVHEDADGADGGNDEEDVQLKSVDNHGNELPVFANLESEILF